MKQIIFIFSIFLLIGSSCSKGSKKSSKTETLYIVTTTSTLNNEGEKLKKKIAIGELLPPEMFDRKEVISEISSDYFEVRLSLQKTGGYLADKQILWTVEPFKLVFLTISDEKGNKIKFQTSNEFLNYMSAHGYEMVDQVQDEYGGEYTFKKK